MEKLVVTYQISDGCTYSCDVVIGINYESADAFLFHLEEKAEAFCELLSTYDKETAIWSKKMGEIQHRYMRASQASQANPTDKHKKNILADLEKEQIAHSTVAPKYPSSQITLSEYKFDLNEIVGMDGKGNFSLPSVETLDNWFAGKVLEHLQNSN